MISHSAFGCLDQFTVLTRPIKLGSIVDIVWQQSLTKRFLKVLSHAANLSERKEQILASKEAVALFLSTYIRIKGVLTLPLLI